MTGGVTWREEDARGLTLWVRRTRRWLVWMVLILMVGGEVVAQEVSETSAALLTAPAVPIAEVRGRVAKREKPRIRGVVTFQIAPGFVFLQDESGAVCVHVRKRLTMKKGDVVDLVVDNFSTKGDWYVAFVAQVSGSKALPEPRSLRADEVKLDQHDAMRLKIRGKVIGRSRSTHDYYVNEVYVPVTYDVLTADCDGLNVRMAFLTGTDVAEEFPRGTVAEFIGTARLHEQKREEKELYIAMWVDGLGDVKVVEWPPFWSSRRVRRWSLIAGLVLLGGVLVIALVLLVQRRKLKLVRASEERFRALVDNSFELTVVIDAQGRMKYLTPAAKRMFGVPGAEGPLKEGEFKAMVHPDDRQQVKQARDEVLRTPGSTVRITDCRMMTREGAVRHTEAVGTNCLEVRGVEGIVINIRDVTERKLAEETLRRSNASLEQRVAERTAELHRALAHERELGEMKSSFVSLVSHEFRTPLGVIMSATEVLQRYFDHLTPEKRLKHLGMIFRSTKNLAQLIEEVLLLARVEDGKMQFSPEVQDLEKVCRTLVDEVHSATAGACPIHFACLPGLEGAMTDETVLRQIVNNLLSNAVKYSDEGKAVDFSVERRNGDAVLTIKDRGIGIPPEDQERLFTTFTRGSNVGQRPGTGLGLVIVDRCVKLHGGRLKIDSEAGQGTTVTVTLPVFGK